MTCPYNRKTLKQVVQGTNNIDENGFIKSKQDVILEEYTLMDCPKENCGAWRDNRCCYFYSG